MWQIITQAMFISVWRTLSRIDLEKVSVVPFLLLVNSSIIQRLFMQNHLFYRYFHFNCRKKLWGKGKRKISFFEAGIVFFLMAMLNCVTYTHMDSIGNSRKCLGIPWGSLGQASVLKLGQHQSRSVQSVHSHTPRTHTHTYIFVCIHIHIHVHAHTRQMTTFIGFHYF